MPTWSAALFDLDGTLTDPAEGIIKCIEHAFAQLGVSSPAAGELEHWIGPPLHTSLTEVLGDAKLAQQALQFYRQRFASVGLYENRLIPGIGELLETLVAGGVTCYLATSKPGVYASQIVRYFELNRWFSGVYGSELDGRRSDKTELLAWLLERESINPPGQAVMIGDCWHDVQGAKDNSIAALGVTWGYGSRQELESAGAFRVVDTPGQLAEYFIGHDEEPT